jgi:signal transduction histidine kinase
MEEFSYSVSHDLRAPIRTMIVYADVLLSDHAEKLDHEVQRFLERILKNACRMDALVRDTLAYSKLARREITLTAVPLARLLDDVIAALDLPAGTPPITCTSLSNTVLAHEPSLVQAVTNLLRNALKFVAPSVAPCVEVWSELHDGRIRLWVKDNGIGIPPEWQARLFGMFERLHVDRNYEGTGIGLAMVRKAIERMGGRVGVESDGVHGSQFWIELSSPIGSDEMLGSD